MTPARRILLDWLAATLAAELRAPVHTEDHDDIDTIAPASATANQRRLKRGEAVGLKS